MTNTTDTNQASEDELTLEKLLKFLYGKEPISGRWFGEKYEGEPMFWWRPELKRLIRTEKLKLLAEVREQVVGEPIPYDWDDDIDDMTKWKYYTGYKSNANDFVAGYNRSRAERLEHLTKLEAEL